MSHCAVCMGQGLRRDHQREGVAWSKREAPWQTFLFMFYYELVKPIHSREETNELPQSVTSRPQLSTHASVVQSALPLKPPLPGCWDTDLRHHVIPAMNISANFSKR